MAQEIDNPTDLITEGSVWKSRTRDFSVRVLMTTNVTLIGSKVEDKFPCRVVYANPENNVFDRTVDEFIEQFVFFNIDPELEQRVQGLFDPLLYTEDEAVDDESAEEPAEETEGTETESGDFGLTAEPQEQSSPFVALFSYADGAEGITVAPESLALSCTGYEVYPDFTNGMVFHHLHFDANITYADLVAAFSTSPDNTHPVIDLITLTGDDNGLMWDTFGGIFPAIVYGERFHKVIIATSPEEETPATETPVMLGEPVGSGAIADNAARVGSSADSAGAIADNTNVFGTAPDDGVFGDVSNAVSANAAGVETAHPVGVAPGQAATLDVNIAY